MNYMWISDPKVVEAMTKEYGEVDQSTSLDQVVELMLNNNWEEVLVTGKAHKLLGLVTKEHLFSSMAGGLPKSSPIKEICCSELITTRPDEDLAKARDVMRRHKIGRLPVIGDTGKMLGILTAKDVCNGFSTKLQKQGEQLCAVMENIAEAIQVVDCDGIVSFWNKGAERLFGIKGSDIVGKRLDDFLPDDLTLKAINNSKSYRNIMGELKDGVYVVRHAVPVVTPSGFTVGAVCTTEDVSHLKTLMAQLDQANNRVKNLERLIDNKEELEDCLFYTLDTKTLRVLDQARRVGQTDATVMVQGQSGTGKELLANIIWRHSKRANKPLIEVNCSAIPEALFESEMFGYEAGSFTGGNRAGKPGKFELANQATIFLDEVGDLPVDMQAKLLRVIQERRFYRVGGTHPIEVDVRLIAATNRDIGSLVADGRFREDLFYRLNVVILEIPPLEMRKADIPGLVAKFLGNLDRVYQNGTKRVDQAVLDLFAAYDWPGNVRQLQNMLENIVIMMDDELISVKTLAEVGVLDILTAGQDRNVTRTAKLSGQTVETGFDQVIEQRQRELIRKALSECYDNKSKAAKMLGIPRSTLYYKMKSLGIKDNPVIMD